MEKEEVVREEGEENKKSLEEVKNTEFVTVSKLQTLNPTNPLRVVVERAQPAPTPSPPPPHPHPHPLNVSSTPQSSTTFTLNSRKYTNRISLFLFLLHMVVAIGLVCFLGFKAVQGMLKEGSSQRKERRILQYWFPQVECSAILGILLAFIWQKAFRVWPAFMITFILWSSFATTLSAGVLLLCFQKPSTDGVGVALVGFSIGSGLYACWVTRRIAFTARVISKSLEPVAKFSDINQHTYWMLGIGFVWISLWVLAMIGALNFYYPPLVIILLLLSLAWTAEVLRNVANLTVSRLIGLYYLRGMQSSSQFCFQRALTRNLGSACLGSLFVPSIEALRIVARGLNLLEGEDEFMFSCAHCCLRVMESIFRYGNGWAYVQITEMAQMAYNYFNQVNPSTNDWAVKVHVLRVWEVLDIKENIVKSIDFILMDGNGEQMHGSIPKNIYPDFEEHLQEGKNLHLEEFGVEEKPKKYYCPVKHMYNIVLRNVTIMNYLEANETFPKPHFDFLEFSKIPARSGLHDYLIDVIGIFNELKEVEITKNHKKKKELIIDDQNEKSAKVTFWGEDINKIPEPLDNNGERPILIITSTIVKEFREEYNLQSTFGTRVYINMDIPQVEYLKPSVNNPRAKFDTPIKRQRPPAEMKTIQEIKTLLHVKTQGEYFCTATTKSLNEKIGWYFNFCPKCGKQAYPRGTGYWCYRCKVTVEFPDSRYKIELELEDPIGTIKVTAFGKEAELLLNCSFDSMIDLSLKDDGNSLVSARLQRIIGKTENFRLRITEYNIFNPTSALTVSQIGNGKEKEDKRIKN